MKDKLYVLELMKRIPIPNKNDKNISTRDLLVAADFSQEEKDILMDFAKTSRSSYKVNTHDRLACLRMHVPFFLYHCKVEYGIQYSQWDRTDKLLYVLMGTTAYTDLDYVTDPLMGCDMASLPLTPTGRASTKAILMAMNLDPDKVPVGVITEPFKVHYLELTKRVRDRESPDWASGEVDHWTENNTMGGRYRYITTKLCTREFKYLMNTVHDARRGINKFSADKFIPGMIFDLYNWDNEDIAGFPSLAITVFPSLAITVPNLMQRLKVPSTSAGQKVSPVDVLREANFTEHEKDLLRNFRPRAFTGDTYTNFNVPFFLYYCYKEHGIAYDQWDLQSSCISVLEGSEVYSSLRGADKGFLKKLLETDLYMGPVHITKWDLVIDEVLHRCDFSVSTVPKAFFNCDPEKGLDTSSITPLFSTLLGYIYHMKRPESNLELVKGGLLYDELLAFHNTQWFKEKRAIYLKEKEAKAEQEAKQKEAEKAQAEQEAKRKKEQKDKEILEKAKEVRERVMEAEESRKKAEKAAKDAKFREEHPNWTPLW